MKILLLSAYDATSHRYWRERLQAGLKSFEFVTLRLPPRFFNWRIRGNSLSWYRECESLLNENFALCVATSMVDLATLRGLAPALCRLPTVLYFHENQFAYPASDRALAEPQRIEPQMVQLYSAITADTLLFNSDYNRQTFMRGLQALLNRFPDGVPDGIATELNAKSEVLPVPLDGPREEMANINRCEPVHLLWNHRWEYDKAPHRLLAFLRILPESLRLRVHIVGQSFRQVPPEFAEIRNLLESRQWLGEWGYIEDSQRYHDLIQRCHFVISTAEHDFQGLAILESVIKGCIPLLPERLAYPEFIPREFLYQSRADVQDEALSMKSTFLRLLDANSLPNIDLEPVLADKVLPRYEKLFKDLAVSNNPH